MSGRLYTVEFEAQTVATASGDVDLFELDAAAEKPIELVGLFIKTTSELQDAQAEWLRLRVIRGHTVGQRVKKNAAAQTRPRKSACVTARPC